MVSNNDPPVYFEVGLLRGADLQETIEAVNSLSYDLSLHIINDQRNAITGSTTKEVMEGKLEARLKLLHGREWIPIESPKVPPALKKYISHIRIIDFE
ncbi:hypothetical protein HYX16_02445 [Candidatus Woesearchaeota archaeon]|nr:hypothetical protein [Candidatus Woesearchaeota archaeon]